MRVFDLGGGFDGCDHVAEHCGLAIVKAETNLKPTREACMSWRLGLIFAAPDPQGYGIGQRALFGLERVELELAEWDWTGRDRAEWTSAATRCGAELAGEGMSAIDGPSGQCPIAPHGCDGDFEQRGREAAVAGGCWRG